MSKQGPTLPTPLPRCTVFQPSRTVGKSARRSNQLIAIEQILKCVYMIAKDTSNEMQAE